MTITFELVVGATSTNCNDGTTYKLIGEFTPNTVANEDGTVTDVFHLQVGGTSVATMYANRDVLYGIQHSAERWMDHKDSVDRVFIHYAPDGVATQRRTQALNIAITDVTLSGGQTPQALVRFIDLNITHPNWAEAIDEVAVLLSNTNGTDVSDGTLKQFNCNDGSGASPNDRVSYCYINDEDVAGDLPAACKLTITTALNTRMFYGVGYIYDKTEILQYEGEGFTGSSDQGDANCSGAFYTALTANATQYLNYTASKTKGAWYWPVIRMKWGAANGGITLQVGPGGIPVTTYPTYTTTDFGLISCDPIKLPQNYTSASPSFPLYITTTVNSSIDFVQLIPIDCGWRYVQLCDETGVVGDTLVDNGYLGQVYYTNTAAQLDTSYNGPGIMLEPGKDQWFWLLGQTGAPGASGGADITDTLYLLLTYRPRYRSLV